MDEERKLVIPDLHKRLTAFEDERVEAQLKVEEWTEKYTVNVG